MKWHYPELIYMNETIFLLILGKRFTIKSLSLTKGYCIFPCKPCFGLQVQDASTDSNNLNDRHVKTKKALKLFDQTIPPDSKRASDYDKHNLCFQDI